MDTFETTAANLTAGQRIHRVRPNPLSSLFHEPVDAVILSVQEHPEYPGTIHIELEPGIATSSALNLAADRVVTVVEG